MAAETNTEAAAGDLLAAAAVNHPTLGRIADPRLAYLTGIAEGMRLGWRAACDELERIAEKDDE